MDKLLKEARKGNSDAFVSLMQKQMKNMYKAAYSILAKEEDVADAISETILTCWEKMGQLQEERYFRTWMTRILINKCNDILRKRQMLVFTEEVPETGVIDAEFSNLEWKEALSELEEKYRTVIILYYVEGFKMSEIAQILDIPENTVRTRMARARKKMETIYYPQMKRRSQT